jgi:sec-independent protein translocase protein TatA
MTNFAARIHKLPQQGGKFAVEKIISWEAIVLVELKYRSQFVEHFRKNTMFGLGWAEVAIILVIGLAIFGSKKIPELGGALGKTLRGFQDEMKKPSDREDDLDE